MLYAWFAKQEGQVNSDDNDVSSAPPTAITTSNDAVVDLESGTSGKTESHTESSENALHVVSTVTPAISDTRGYNTDDKRTGTLTVWIQHFVR